MKNIILAVFSLIMLTKPLWPVVDYAVNYNYIVNVLCENKDKPEMHCNGKCHLTKELAKEASAENKNPFTGKVSKTEIPQFIISENVKEFTLAIETENASIAKIGYKPNLNPSLFTSKILHPPRFV